MDDPFGWFISHLIAATLGGLGVVLLLYAHDVVTGPEE